MIAKRSFITALLAFLPLAATAQDLLIFTVKPKKAELPAQRFVIVAPTPDKPVSAKHGGIYTLWQSTKNGDTTEYTSRQEFFGLEITTKRVGDQFDIQFADTRLKRIQTTPEGLPFGTESDAFRFGTTVAVGDETLRIGGNDAYDVELTRTSAKDSQ